MAGRCRGVGDSLHEAPGRGVLACSGELCPALPRTGAPGQGPVSQGFMERTHDAYSSSCPSSARPLRPRTSGQWRCFLGMSHEGCHPACCPGTDPLTSGCVSAMGLSVHVSSGIRATPCRGMVTWLTARGRDKRQPVSALSTGGGTPEQKGGGWWWDPRPGDRPPPDWQHWGP